VKQHSVHIIEGIDISNIVIRNLTILYNWPGAVGRVGAIHLENVSGNVEKCVIRNNGRGAGLSMLGNFSGNISSNIFSGNGGGGFRAGAFTGDVSGNTFSDNDFSGCKIGWGCFLNWTINVVSTLTQMGKSFRQQSRKFLTRR
jgi:hypothetical protein